ncbi:cytochrome C oxidase subunit I [Streptomyces sp. NPDC048566]|uniref:cytochrome C oxidase subunit I n=1 Tax=Streptomyces sp. NPDC048566 TaxID=3365569 RepID=UPI00371A7BD5
MSDLPRRESAASIGNQVEGYLLWSATVAEAERRAEEFLRPLDWLTTSQRAEIEQCYVADNLRRARQDLERVAARSRSLRAEYENRYRSLRRRCLGVTLAVWAALTTAVALLCVL